METNRVRRLVACHFFNARKDAVSVLAKLASNSSAGLLGFLYLPRDIVASPVLAIELEARQKRTLDPELEGLTVPLASDWLGIDRVGGGGSETFMLWFSADVDAWRDVRPRDARSFVETRIRYWMALLATRLFISISCESDYSELKRRSVTPPPRVGFGTPPLRAAFVYLLSPDVLAALDEAGNRLTVLRVSDVAREHQFHWAHATSDWLAVPRATAARKDDAWPFQIKPSAGTDFVRYTPLFRAVPLL